MELYYKEGKKLYTMAGLDSEDHDLFDVHMIKVNSNQDIIAHMELKKHDYVFVLETGFISDLNDEQYTHVLNFIETCPTITKYLKNGEVINKKPSKLLLALEPLTKLPSSSIGDILLNIIKECTTNGIEGDSSMDNKQEMNKREFLEIIEAIMAKYSQTLQIAESLVGSMTIQETLSKCEMEDMKEELLRVKGDVKTDNTITNSKRPTRSMIELVKSLENLSKFQNKRLINAHKYEAKLEKELKELKEYVVDMEQQLNLGGNKQ